MINNNKETKEELLKQLEEIKKKVEQIDEEEKKFKFCEEGFTIWADGGISSRLCLTGCSTVARGRIFPTEDLAVKYDKTITNSYKIAQAVAQLAPDYEPDWSEDNCEDKYFLMYYPSNKKWCINSRCSYGVTGVVTFPESIKDQMLELASSGQLNLEV